jgi:hypothetical protein
MRRSRKARSVGGLTLTLHHFLSVKLVKDEDGYACFGGTPKEDVKLLFHGVTHIDECLGGLLSSQLARASAFIICV